MKRFYCLLLGVTLCLLLAACSSVDYNTPKSTELKEAYSFYENSVKKIVTNLKVTPEQGDEIFIVLVSIGADSEIGMITKKYGTDNTYTVSWYGATSRELDLIDGVVSEIRYLSNVIYPPAVEVPIIPADAPPQRENASGIADKNIDELSKNLKIRDVNNDVTGNWRYVRLNDSSDFVYYALSYYNEYFNNDKEVHAIINDTLNTTTGISCVAGTLNVTVHEYVKDEEYDAKKLYGGVLLADYFIYLDNGDIVVIDYDN